MVSCFIGVGLALKSIVRLPGPSRFPPSLQQAAQIFDKQAKPSDVYKWLSPVGLGRLCGPQQAGAEHAFPEAPTPAPESHLPQHQREGLSVSLSLRIIRDVVGRGHKHPCV